MVSIPFIFMLAMDYFDLLSYCFLNYLVFNAAGLLAQPFVISASVLSTLGAACTSIY